MFCPKCGSQIKDWSKFCSKCGAPIVASHVESEKPVDSYSARPTEDSAPSSIASAIAAVNKAVHDGRGAHRVATADSSRNDSVADLPQVSSPRFSLLALDVGLFALITFFPWIGSYYTQQGGALSLPSLAIEAAKLASQASQYSSLANQLGGGSAYQLAMGTLVFVAVVAAIGWVLVVKNLCADVQADYSGRNVVGKGAMSVAILAAVVQLAAWVGVASAQSMLKNQYYDLSVLGTGILQTTLWVWVSLGCGIATHYYRKKVLSGV